MSLVDVIKQESEELLSEVISHYHYLHQHPELSYQEKNTSEYIIRFLDVEGIDYLKNIGGFGVLAMIKGEAFESDKEIALCADMDEIGRASCRERV